MDSHDFAPHFPRHDDVGRHRRRTELEAIDGKGGNRGDNQPR